MNVHNFPQFPVIKNCANEQVWEKYNLKDVIKWKLTWSIDNDCKIDRTYDK